MSLAYITATAIRSVAGNTEDTIDAIFNKKCNLKIYDSIIDDKKVCIGKFPQEITFQQLLIDSVSEVLKKSNLSSFHNTLLLVGSSVGGMATTEKFFFKENSYSSIDPEKHIINAIATILDDKFKFKSHRSYSTACTSSANALKTAKELLVLNAYENILVVGADEICMTTVFGFSSLGILSDEPCTPFKENRKGMNVAEGIGVLLLQNKATTDSIILAGAGASSDAYHIANPDPSSNGAKQSIFNSLFDANIDANQIDYINAHGTGTGANDLVEANAIIEIFDNVSVSSTKSIIGHTLGAAGAIEAIISVEVLKQQLLAPQLDSTNKEKKINLIDYKKDAEVHYVLSNSFAFGGNNVSLVFGKKNENKC